MDRMRPAFGVLDSSIKMKVSDFNPLKSLVHSIVLRSISMKKEHLLLLLFILAKFGLQYLAVHPDYDLQRDEFLHLDQARHLAWSYLSVPPFISWNSVLIQWLGGGEFWVRFFPALFGVLTLWVVWDLVKRLGGNLFAQSLAAMALLCSALIRMNLLYQPNSVDVLCWTFVFYALIRYVQEKKSKWLYLLSICFAIGVLNKYNIGFLALGLLPALLLTNRKIFQDKSLYKALLICFLMITPNLIWQIQNGFPVLTHMNMLSRYQLVNNSRIGFLMEQLLFYYPSLPIWIGGLVYLLFGKNTAKMRFVGLTFLFTMGFFAFFKAKGYYAIGLYPVLLAFGSVWVSNGIKRLRSPYLPIIGTLALLLPMILFIPAFALIHPVYSPEKLLKDPPPYSKLGLNRWEDGKEYPIPQDFADMLGWSELAVLVDSAYSYAPSSGRILIICDNYGQAGAINFYTKTRGLEAFTMNADYLYWIDLEEKVDHLILVRSKDEPITERELGFFDQYQSIGSIQNPLARENGTSVHLLINAKGDLNAILKEEVKKEKEIWNGTSPN
jgi:hypothetical protein